MNLPRCTRTRNIQCTKLTLVLASSLDTGKAYFQVYGQVNRKRRHTSNQLSYQMNISLPGTPVKELSMVLHLNVDKHMQCFLGTNVMDLFTDKKISRKDGHY